MKKIVFLLIVGMVSNLGMYALTSKGAIDVEKNQYFKEFMEADLGNGLTYKKFSSKEREALRYFLGLIVLQEHPEMLKDASDKDLERLAKKMQESTFVILKSKNMRNITHSDLQTPFQDFYNGPTGKIDLKDKKARDVFEKNLQEVFFVVFDHVRTHGKLP